MMTPVRVVGVSCASGLDCQGQILWNRTEKRKGVYVLEITCFERCNGSKNS